MVIRYDSDVIYHLVAGMILDPRAGPLLQTFRGVLHQAGFVLWRVQAAVRVWKLKLCCSKKTKGD